MFRSINNSMRFVPGLLVALLAVFAMAKDKPGDNVVVLHGMIMDSQCAYNVHSDGHSHDLMNKSNIHGAKGEEGCTQYCVKDMGGSYVLVVKKEDVYKLEDQAKPEPFAGRKVKITGVVNSSTNTIRNFEIEAEK